MPRDQPTANLPLPSRRKRRLISAFIALHWIAALLSLNPVWHWAAADAPWNERLLTGAKRLGLAYMNLVGHPQSWRMFVGVTADMTKHTHADIHLADGSSRTHLFPRFARLPYLEAQRQHRHRRLHRALARANHTLRSGTARWLARQYGSAANPPQRVDLILESVLVPPPTPVNTRQRTDFTRAIRLQPTVRRDTLLQYIVRPEDL